jgi:hypothetical protein
VIAGWAGAFSLKFDSRTYRRCSAHFRQAQAGSALIWLVIDNLRRWTTIQSGFWMVTSDFSVAVLVVRFAVFSQMPFAEAKPQLAPTAIHKSVRRK